MPFRDTGETIEQPRREIIVRKEVIRQVPLMTGTMDSLTVGSLTVRDISLADPSVLYPPNPHLLKKPYLHFQDNETVGFKIDDTPFLEYSKHAKKVRCENIEASNVLLQTVTGTSGSFQTLSVTTLNVPTLDLSLLKVDRIEALSNILGGVVLRDGGFSAPGDVNVGSHFIANTGNVGGVACKDGIVASKHVYTTTLSAEHIETDRIHCGSPYIVLGNVQLMSGDIQCKHIAAEQGTFERVRCTMLESDNKKLTILSEISTLSGSTHNVGNLSIRESNTTFPGTFESLGIHTKKLESQDMFADTLNTSSATIGGVNIQDNCIHAHTCKVDHLTVTENTVSFSNVNTQHLDAASMSTVNLVAENVQASDFRLKDGTSILNAVFPPGMIMLYNGKAPRGWLECNGKGGTPNLPSPAPNVIYIVRR